MDIAHVIFTLMINLITLGDGNCLLHAASLACFGISDSKSNNPNNPNNRDSPDIHTYDILDNPDNLVEARYTLNDSLIALTALMDITHVIFTHMITLNIR